MILKRTETKQIKVGNIVIGGQNKVVIQSMCNIKTSKIEKVIEQILELEVKGVELIRVSIMDESDALAIKEIKRKIHIPIVADIHFDYRLALLALENGVDKIRINPGNIGDIEKIKKVVDKCKELNVPIRIGVNSGSLDSSFENSDEKVRAEQLVASAKKHVDILESLGFYNIVLSLKGSNVLETIEAYRLASSLFPYPLHLGITEAGTKEIGLIRSVAGLSPLLEQGIGDTIRISLTDEPKEEVKACKRLLHDLGLYPNYPTLISCPTCGRTQVDLIEVAKIVEDLLETIYSPITVAIMGCVVNGPGEAKHADIGIAGGKDEWLLFKHGKVIEKVSKERILNRLEEEIKSLIK